MLYAHSFAMFISPPTSTIALVFFALMAASFLVPYLKKYLPNDSPPLTTACQAGAALSIFYWIHTPVWPFPYFLMGLIGYSFILFVLGSTLSKPMLRFFSYGLFIIGSLRFIQVYDRLMAPALFIHMNIIYAFFSFGLFFAYLLWPRFQRNFTPAEKNFLTSMLAPIGTIINSLWWRDWIASYFLAGSAAQQSALATLHICYGLLVIGCGYYFRAALLRYLGALIALGSLYHLYLLFC